MKTTKICPKCQSREILMIPGSIDNLGSGDHIKTGLGPFSYVEVDRYVCVECGYSEEWINKRYISKLIDKYE